MSLNSERVRAWRSKNLAAGLCQRNGRRVFVDALMAYGDVQCSCCRIDNIGLLTLDHIDGGGAEHRSRVGPNLAQWLKQNHYPDVGLRVLCVNCNSGRARNGGVCPHEDQNGIFQEEAQTGS
jgi:hypothetical protein